MRDEVWTRAARAQGSIARKALEWEQRLERAAQEVQSGAVTPEGQATLNLARASLGQIDATPENLRALAGRYRHQREVVQSDGSDGYVIVGASLEELQCRARDEHWDRQPNARTLMLTPRGSRTTYLNTDADAIDEDDALNDGIAHDALHTGDEGLGDEQIGGQYAYGRGLAPNRRAYLDMTAANPNQASRNPDHIVALEFARPLPQRPIDWGAVFRRLRGR